MKHYGWNVRAIFLFLGILALGLWGCASIKPVPRAKLQVIPDKTVLSLALIKKPIQFKGSGFVPKEMVVMEMVLPPGVKIKTVNDGENVGLAYTNADEEGNFQAAMAPTATLNWFFQVGWTPLLTPDLKQMKPLSPGVYEIQAVGMDSEAVGRASLTILARPKKK